MKRISTGMYDLGALRDGDIKTAVILNLNTGYIILNNNNLGNAGAWSDKVKIQEAHYHNTEPWFQL